jgi:murein DD-endopeptidase MepM/ murein hydrolase activator NlpD
VRSYPGGVRHDYKDSGNAPRAINLRAFDPRSFKFHAVNRRHLSWFVAGFVLPLVSVTLLLVSETNESMVPAEPPVTAAPSSAAGPFGSELPALIPLEPTPMVLLPSSRERVPVELPPPPPRGARPGQTLRPEDLERNALLAQGEPLMLSVKSGDSLDSMFRRNGLSIADLGAMIRLPEAADDLAKIKPGDKFEIIHDGGRVLSLSREVSESQELWVKRDGEGYLAELVDLETEVRTAGAHGIIESSLFVAGTEAGISDAVTMEMVGKFQWDIDFILDVRAGDSFTVVYEEIWRDGVKLRDGDIIAAEFVNRGEVFRVARFVDATGKADYYTPDGLNVRKAFLRNPIPIVRISSNFNPNRRHPILNVIRAHRGVDYAAPTGTQIFASGDGKVIARGENGSYGNRVEIQHGGNVTTLYAHMSKFGNYKVGDRVRQGDVIGYVGMTGGATGPHLHYEYRINGVHQNPRTVDLPDVEAIADEYRAEFQRATAPLWHQLDLYQGPLLASNAD